MLVCQTCGEENPERARFCWNCGAPLSPVAPATEERKVVTVLFCDLVGFTARSDQADPEDVKATLRPFHARLKQEIEHFGGTLDKFIGDGVLGVFGAPAAHEDDPERAVRAALRIQEAIEEMNGADPTRRLAARVGIATGEAVVAFGEGPQIGENVTGDVVNTASRLQSIAQPGGIVAAESTYLATATSFAWEATPPVTVKGKAEPIAIWRPTAVLSRYGVGVDPREHRGTPFVGREEELFLLKATFRRMLREASAQMVTVTGEPGVGKSRLIAQLFAHVDELPEIVRWRQGRCLPYGDGITFWALGEIVKAQAGILDSDQPKEVRAKLDRSVETLFEDEQEREWVAARLAALVGTAAGGEAESVAREETATAWRRFLEVLADEYPLILVFEDLHWADDPMLSFIDELVGWAKELPILVICAARPELYERQPEWGGGKPNSTTIPLWPLDDRDTSALIAALLEDIVLPPETQAMLLERSGGNPLYAEEFVRMLTDQGIVADEGALRMQRGEPIAVPDSIHSLVAARLDTLSAQRKELLHDAAVVGNTFWDGALAEMSGMDLRDVRHELHEMAVKELVRPARSSSFEGQSEYSFWHMLIRDVAYAQIPRSTRGEKHLAVASWIERVSENGIGDRGEVLAHHYETALDLARAAGHEDVSELTDAVCSALSMAGDRALGLDVVKAAAYYQRAMDVAAPGARPHLLVRMAKALSMMGRYQEAQESAQEAIEAFRAAGDANGVGEAMSMASSALTKLGDSARSTEMLEGARRILEEGPPGPELARVYSRLAGLCLISGRLAESLSWAEKSLALARELDLQDAIVRALQFRGAARCDLGDPGGLEDLWEALREGLDLGLGEETALCYGNLAFQLWLKEGPDVAYQVWSAGVEFAEVRGFASHAMWGRAGQLEVLFDLGRWDELLSVGDMILRWDAGTGGSEVGIFARVYRGMVLGYRGELTEAAEISTLCLEQARAVGYPEYVAPALYTAMVVERAAGRLPEAIELAREFARVTDDQPGFRAHYLPGAMRSLLVAGLPDQAAALLVGDEDVKSQRYRHCLDTGRALLEEAAGSKEQAAALHAALAHDWHAYGFPLEQGQALYGQGRCLVALGRPEEAVGALAGAKRIFEDLRATPLVVAVDALLSPLTALTS